MTGPRPFHPLVLFVVVCSAALAAFFALAPPGAVSADAPPAMFSARRAFPDIQTVAQRPHPVGSPDSVRVRGHLVDRLEALGLNPTVSAVAARRSDGSSVTVRNLAGILPGTDPSLPAIALMSHYDSTSRGPGAGDDAAGVAASLEIARALKAFGPHRRDLVVLITDGEEAGLLGAKAFFGAHSLASRIGAVVNLEARGNSGRAVMFETHRDAGPMIAALRRAGALRGASSLMPDLYRRLPNDTDLTEALKAGKQGLNFAFFGGQAAYHQPTDTPANLDPGSVQHLGDQALAVTRALVDAPALPPRGPDPVYADLLGGPVVQYPPWAGWLLVGLTAGGLVLAVRRRPAGVRSILFGATAFGLSVSAAACALLLVSGLAQQRADAFADLLAHYPLALAGYVAVASGAAILPLALLARRRPAPEPLWPLWLGAAWVLLAAAVALQALAPLDAFMAAWPAAGAVAGALLWSLRALPARIAAGAILALALAQVFYWAGLMFSLVGVAIPAVLGGFALLGGPLVIPFVVPVFARPGGVSAAAALALVGAATVLLSA